MTSWSPEATGPPVTACSWHPDRQTGLSCSRCGLPACPECLREASVGFHCRDCLARARAHYRPARTISGAQLGTRPLFTWVLLAINVAAFAVTAGQARSTSAMMSSSLWLDGALIPGSVAAGQWWRLLTSGFLHVGLVHVAVNMLSLYFLGPTLEQVLGRVRFLVVYLLSLLGGSVAVMVGASSFTVGASGAIFGLLGALLVTFKRLRADYRQLLVVLGINLVMSFTIAGISWQAHVGGLIVGALAGVAMVYTPQRRRTAIQVAVCTVLLVICLAVIVWRMTTIAPTLCEFLELGPGGPGVYCRTS